MLLSRCSRLIAAAAVSAGRELAAERQQRRIQSRAPEDLPDDEQPALTLITKNGRAQRIA